MMNAKEELIDHLQHIEKRADVEWIEVYRADYWEAAPEIHVSGTLEEVLPQLDFEYDGGYGSQELFGCIWYKDGSWSQRAEYDGSEWWEHMTRPPLPTEQ